MVSPIIPKEDRVKVMKKEPEMMCIDSRGKNRGQLDQFISTQYLVWTNSLLQLFPMSTHILLNWVPNKNKLLENFWNPLVRLLRPKIFLIVKMILEFKKNFVRPISDLCSFLLPKWNTKLLYLSEIICKKPKKFQTGHIF